VAEFDPTGRSQHEAGAKVDGGKVDLTLVPPEVAEAMARVQDYGAKKYTRDGWRSVPDAARRYYAALKRHLAAFEKGEDVDPETGLHHLDHALCNLGFLAWFREHGVDVGGWRYRDQ